MSARSATLAGPAAAASGDAGGTVPRAPRLAFLGVGWIGLARLRAVVASGSARVLAVADPSRERRSAAAEVAPGSAQAENLEELLALQPDGVVIATPSALHAAQAVQALEAGAAVFCQKPLGRTARETEWVVSAARRANRLLDVDLCYRRTRAAVALKELARAGELGHVFAADLVFHNAYGPDKPWFRDARLSGGGCVMDLGIHLVDLALWLLDFPAVRVVAAHLRTAGRAWRPEEVEDFAVATLELAGGGVVRLTTSWNLHAGREAVISAELHGTAGGAALRNVEGSFYDLIAERHRGTARERLVEPPDDWGGRALVTWAERLARGARFDAAVEQLVTLSRTLDHIYQAAGEEDRRP